MDPTTNLVTRLTARLDEMGDNATSDRAEQQVDGYRAWLDTGEDLPRLATDLGLLVDDRPTALATALAKSAEELFAIAGRVAR